MNDCIFCKIAAGEIASNKLFEDDNMVIIKDLNPQAKIHLLLIPKKHFVNIEELAEQDPDLLKNCFVALSKLSKQLGLGDGYRIVTNIGENGCQSVKHIHIHLLGGEKLADKMG